MPRVALIVVSLFFFIGALSHFFVPEFFIQAMPDYLGYHYEIVYLSGVLELLGAIGILIKKTRSLAGYGLILLCILVFPVNVNMALHPEQFNSIPVFLLYLRLPLQLVIIWFIWRAISVRKSV